MITFLLKAYRSIFNVLLIIFLIIGSISGMVIGYKNSNFFITEKITYTCLGLVLGLIITFLIELCIVTPIVALIEINHKLELITKKIIGEENKSSTSPISKKIKEQQTDTETLSLSIETEKTVSVPYWFCKKCNKENSGRNNTCWNCGTTREKETICSPYWFCKNCNKENSSKNNTCWNCGTTKSE